MHVLVAGAGWLGSALSRALAREGHRVTAVRRDPGRAAALASPGSRPAGARPVRGRGRVERLPRDLDAVVACQTAGADGPEAYRRAYVDAHADAPRRAAEPAGRPAALVYTGSTGVFGQRDGSDVDEETAARAGQPDGGGAGRGGAARHSAPPACRASAAWSCASRGSTARAGTGRSSGSGAARSRSGPGDGAWLNLCHLDDAVAAVLAAARARGRRGASTTPPTPSRCAVATSRTWVARAGWGSRRRACRTAARRAVAPRPAHPRRADPRRAGARAPAHPTFREGLAIELRD